MANDRAAKLDDAARAYVVQALACWDTPAQVVEAVRKDYGVQITPQSIEAYNPTKKAGAKLAVKWKALFEETRKAFLEGQAEIGISHRVVRLRALERMAAKAENMGNIALAKDLLEQAAKEVGGAYTNRQRLEHTGKDGEPLPAPTAPQVTIFSLPDNGR